MLIYLNIASLTLHSRHAFHRHSQKTSEGAFSHYLCRAPHVANAHFSVVPFRLAAVIVDFKERRELSYQTRL